MSRRVTQRKMFPSCVRQTRALIYVCNSRTSCEPRTRGYLAVVVPCAGCTNPRAFGQTNGLELQIFILANRGFAGVIYREDLASRWDVPVRSERIRRLVNDARFSYNTPAYIFIATTLIYCLTGKRRRQLLPGPK